MNSTYRIIRVRHRDGGSHQQLAKRSEVEAYQVLVSTLTQQAKPRSWNPPNQIRIKYWFRVGRAIDADNTLKCINDGIEIGLGTQVKGTRVVPIWNDVLFLPCVQELTSKHPDPHVEIEVSYAV